RAQWYESASQLLMPFEGRVVARFSTGFLRFASSDSTYIIRPTLQQFLTFHPEAAPHSATEKLLAVFIGGHDEQVACCWVPVDSSAPYCSPIVRSITGDHRNHPRQGERFLWGGRIWSFGGSKEPGYELH